MYMLICFNPKCSDRATCSITIKAPPDILKKVFNNKIAFYDDKTYIGSCHHHSPHLLVVGLTFTIYRMISRTRIGEICKMHSNEIKELYMKMFMVSKLQGLLSLRRDGGSREEILEQMKSLYAKYSEIEKTITWRAKSAHYFSENSGTPNVLNVAEGFVVITSKFANIEFPLQFSKLEDDMKEIDMIYAHLLRIIEGSKLLCILFNISN